MTSLLDRIVAWYPAYGPTGRAYHGASKRRDALAGWRTRSGDADADTIPDIPTLRERSRDLARNNPIGLGAINVKCTHVVGSGLKLNSHLDREVLSLDDQAADAWESRAEREFRLWGSSQSCDVARTLTFVEQQDLAYRSVLSNGDHFITLAIRERPDTPYGLALQHIESDRVCNAGRKGDTDRLVAGVHKDTDGAPVAYDVYQGHPGSMRGGKRDWVTIPAFGRLTGRRTTLHLYSVLRAGQTRGVPDLAPVVEAIKQLGRYTEAEVDAAVKTALYALVLQSETGDGMAGLETIDEWDAERSGFYKDNPLALKGGSANTVGLFPDDKLTGFDPNRPNSAFDPFMRSVLTQIGMALEVPLEVLIQHFSSSWSASQASLMQLWRFVLGRRAWLARNFCQPVYEAWLAEAVASGRMSAPGYFDDPVIRAAYSGAEWIGDAKGSINEVQQVMSASRRIELGISTLKRETAAITGEDWDKVRKQREKEVRQVGEARASQDTFIASPETNSEGELLDAESA